MRKTKQVIPFKAKTKYAVQKPELFRGQWSFFDIAKDESRSLTFVEGVRFAQHLFCPHCGMFDVQRLKPNHFLCEACDKKFNVKKSSPFEDTRIPIGKWLMAIYLENETTGGINASDLATNIEVNVNTAHHMLEVIRTIGYTQEIWDMTEKLKGYRKRVREIRESDFCWLGGSRVNFTKEQKRIRVDYMDDKVLIFGMLTRNGYVRADIVEGESKNDILPLIVDRIPTNSYFYTDSAAVFDFLTELGYIHESVNHSIGEYVRGDVYTNGIENFWSFLKTGLITSFRNRLTKKNAIQFINAAVFRFNTRYMTAYERMILVLNNIFTYAHQLNKYQIAA